ncbi:uncharacterized protein BP5553_00487 [Venustampulla echinocandica]|uniref:Lipocalin-like domain-containing protein n=1 Tax=Venustampulla echinocandica TaxID=2656787 RepID=A0A370TYC9_9HELO|nr:uncharacterized protein BP5553_00487 [Venustampulla echinocandica]RDL40508.1 hypothetical protein BP5553_00487 [Venustampulla echinocandica]
MASTLKNAARVEGAWELVSFILYAGESLTPIATPLGEKPLGRIMFLPSGYMSCTLTNPDAAKPIQAPQWAVASDDEIVSISRAMTTYCGHFRTFEENGDLMLATKVDIALDPNWIGSVQTRKVILHEAQGTRFMTLKPVQALLLPNGMKATGVLLWKQIEDKKLVASL